MTAVQDAPAGETREVPDVEERRRGVITGLVSVAIGLVTAAILGFNVDSDAESTLRFDPRNAEFEIPDLVLPTQVSVIVLGLAGAAFGILALRRPSRATAALGSTMLLAVIALLVWAARQDSTSVFGLLDGTIRRAVPIVLGALAGILCERAGIINIAIEGMLLTAAFTGAITASAADSLYVGVAAGIAAGAVLGLLLAVLSIRYAVDQIVGGTVINIFALGLTSFLTAQVLVSSPDLNRPGTFRRIAVPLLSDIPFVGPLLFDNTMHVYAMLGLVVFVAWAIYRTRWGLRLRAVGEHPRAADTVGIPVLRTRYRAVVLGGAVAGFAGTFFTLDAVGSFDENMTAGRGFIALAAVIFGRWNPLGAFAAALVFGFAEELQTRLALLDTPIPSEFLLMAPYVVTIVVVAGLVGRSRPPAAGGQPYESG